MLESHSPWLLAPLPHLPHLHTCHIHFISYPFALFPLAQHSFTSHTLAFPSLVPQAHLQTPAGCHAGHPPTSLPRPTSICHTPPIHTPRLGIEIGDDAWKLDIGPPKAQGPVIREHVYVSTRSAANYCLLTWHSLHGNWALCLSPALYVMIGARQLRV